MSSSASAFDTAARHDRAVVLRLDRHRSSDPWAQTHRPADRWRRDPQGPVEAERPNLNNWIVFRQIEDLQFRRVVCKVYPGPHGS